MRIPQVVLLVLGYYVRKSLCQCDQYPAYLANYTGCGSIATQWNQVAQLAVARNKSGPVNSAITFFLLSQVRSAVQE
jgi:hypothetical protein